VEFSLGAAGLATGTCIGAMEGIGATEGTTGPPKTCVLWVIALPGGAAVKT
jgi:hypothetical protein